MPDPYQEESEARKNARRKRHFQQIIRSLERDQAAKGEPMGPTGEFPQGQLVHEDQGELRIGVAANHKDNLVMLAFGVEVKWLAMPPEEALRFAQSIITKAHDLMDPGLNKKGGQ